MALFVIYGVQNSGKTHASWLVYNLLKNAGTELDFNPRELSPRPTFSEVLQNIEDDYNAGRTLSYQDLWALFEYKGKRIAIFSAGDELGDDVDENSYDDGDFISFKNNLYWAERNEIDHVICCARYNKTDGGVRKYILENYKMSVYRWYCKHKFDSAQEQKEEAQRIAIDVFTDIKENC